MTTLNNTKTECDAQLSQLNQEIATSNEEIMNKTNEATELQKQIEKLSTVLESRKDAINKVKAAIVEITDENNKLKQQVKDSDNMLKSFMEIEIPSLSVNV